MISIMNQIINSKATQSIYTDTFANRPSASSQKYGLFIDNTGVQGLFYSNGSTWTKVAGIGGGGGSQGFQSVLTYDSQLTTNNTVNCNNFYFTFDDVSTFTTNSEFITLDATNSITLNTASQIDLKFSGDSYFYMNTTGIALGRFNTDCWFKVQSNLSWTKLVCEDKVGGTQNFFQIDPENKIYAIGDFQNTYYSTYIKLDDTLGTEKITLNATNIELSCSSTNGIYLNAFALDLDPNMVSGGVHNTKSPHHLVVNLSGTPFYIPLYV